MALGSFGAREFAADLAPLLTDSQAMVRRSAAYALGRFGAAEFTPKLKALLKDKDPEVRGTTAQSLGQFGAGGHADDVLGLLRDADPEARRAAWVCSASLPPGWDGGSPFSRGPDADVRQGAVGPDSRRATARSSRLSRIPRTGSVRKRRSRWGGSRERGRALLAALLRDPDRKVRVTAALALGELGRGDPDGVLAGLERDPDRLLAPRRRRPCPPAKSSPAALRRPFRRSRRTTWRSRVSAWPRRTPRRSSTRRRRGTC